jgi:hypothetical protein
MFTVVKCSCILRRDVQIEGVEQKKSEGAGDYRVEVYRPAWIEELARLDGGADFDRNKFGRIILFTQTGLW